MKTKAKLTLAISVLSAVVLSAGVTSTFAWFTTKAQANFNSSTLTVKAPSTLTIQAKDVSNETLGEGYGTTGTPTNSVTGAKKNLGAVSSLTGQSFFTWKALAEDYDNPGTGNSIVAWSAATTNNYKDFVKYNVAVTAAKGEAGKHLGVKVTAPTITGSNINEWYRIGVYFVGTDELPAPKTDLSLAPAATGFQKVFGYDDLTNDTAYSAADTLVNNRVVTKVGTTLHDVADSAFETSAAAAKTAHFVVAIWLEGTLEETQNAAGGDTLAATVSFELR